MRVDGWQDSGVDVKTYPLQDILKPERRYIIPTFQRDYEWTLEGQWRLLFEDLASTADQISFEVRTSSAQGSVLKSKEQEISPHFLGAVVCASLPFATGGVALRSVIDGQQRLTTIQLLIRGLLDVLIANESERAKSVRRMLCSTRTTSLSRPKKSTSCGHVARTENFGQSRSETTFRPTTTITTTFI